jgi:hypothetical protein
MANKKKKGPRFPDAVSGKSKTVTYGYIGRFIDGQIGWFLPEHACGDKYRTDSMSARAIENGKGHREAFELCRITIEVVPGARKKHVR